MTVSRQKLILLLFIPYTVIRYEDYNNLNNKKLKTQF